MVALAIFLVAVGFYLSVAVSIFRWYGRYVGLTPGEKGLVILVSIGWFPMLLFLLFVAFCVKVVELSFGLGER